MEKKKNKLDEFHYHEALDRSYLVANIIEDALVKHPVIRKHRNLKTKIVKAQTLIVEVYQEIGGLEIKLFPESNDKTDNSGVNKKNGV